MNDPNKRIDVNLSSLLSLKAELLRKHEEVDKSRKKQQGAHLASTSVSAGPSERLSTTKKKSSTSQKHAQTPQTSQKQKSRESTNTCDDIEMLEKSKRVLEAKSQFYDRMSRSGGCPEPNDSCLVMFGQKQIKNASVSKSFDRYEVEDRSSSCSSTKNNNAELLLHNTSHIGNSADDDCEDENWVEYTDCLGRSRRCLKEDLSAIKQRDIELARTVAPKLTNRISVEHPGEWFVDNGGTAAILSSDDDDEDAQSMISKASKIDEMHKNWDKQEMENATKQSIHYQDVLFDEARSHGVAYYAFSKDDVERTKQHQDLETMRQTTLIAQQQRDRQRSTREKIIAERVRAAQNRQRARAGLPPLEDIPTVLPQSTNAESAKPELSLESSRTTEHLQKPDAHSSQREAERKQHVRPWDQGKDGVRNAKHPNANGIEHCTMDNVNDTVDEWIYKPEREPMSQTQWNDLRRSDRPDEFAPITLLPIHDDSSTPAQGFQSRHTTKRRIVPASKLAQPFPSQPPQPSCSILSQRPSNPFSKQIMNDTDNDMDINMASSLMTKPPQSPQTPAIQRNAEFAPPVTSDYGPTTPSKHLRHTNTTDQLENAIDAGLRFLRNQSDKNAATTKMKWSSNANY